MDRTNHYEAAFEAYLRERRVGFVPVAEARRAHLGQADVKSVDFIVVGPNDAKLVVDVKGRRFPGGSAERPRPVWQNWSTADDLDALTRWAGHLGPDFRGVLAFVYRIEPPFVLPDSTPDLYPFRDGVYLMRGIEATAYRLRARRRSRRWGTVHLATADFRQLVRPFSEFLTKVATQAQSTRGERPEE